MKYIKEFRDGEKVSGIYMVKSKTSATKQLYKVKRNNRHHRCRSLWVYKERNCSSSRNVRRT